MKRQFIWAVALLQVVLLLVVAVKREWILGQGETVYLRTAPVDPRDIFRGDYVALDYDIAQIPTSVIDQFNKAHPIISKALLENKEHRIVYLSLKVDAKNIASIHGISMLKPNDQPFIKAYMGKGIGNAGRNRSLIKMGIEKYFVEQGAGLVLEEKRGKRDDWQRPMEVEVALGDDGTAVIKSYRWSDLAIRLNTVTGVERLRNNVPEDENRRRSPIIKVGLLNLSDKPMSIAVNEQHCEFELLMNGGRGRQSGQNKLSMANRDCQAFMQGDYQQVILQPQKQYEVEIDFAEAQWLIQHQGDALQIGSLQDNWRGYRLELQVPKQLNTSSTTLWNSPIKTARFFANGRID